MRDARPVIVIGLAALGLVIAADLAAFQLGLVGTVWDPLFGDGSRQVLTSPLSRAFPVPDALAGAVAYGLDLVLAFALALRVWRPAIVAAMLAVLAVLGGVVALALALAQPLIAHAGCTLCLCSTAISVALAVSAVAEARARWPALPRPSQTAIPRPVREEPR
jgi:uncharacterized membrane protein